MASERRSVPLNDKPELRLNNLEIETLIRRYLKEKPEEIENIRIFKKEKEDDSKQRTLDGWLQKSSKKSKESTKISAIENNVNDRRSSDQFRHEISEPPASTFADPLHISLQQCGSPEIQYLDPTELITPNQRKSDSEVICIVDSQDVSDSDFQQAFIDERLEVANKNNSLGIENDICIVYHEPDHHDIVVQNASLSEPVINADALDTITNLEGFEFLDECGNVQSGYLIPSNLFVVSDSSVSKNNPQHEDGQNYALSNLNNLNLEYPGVDPLLGVDENLSLISECTENISEAKDTVFTDSASQIGSDSDERHDSHLKELPLSSKKSGFTSEESCMTKLVSMINENLVNNECNVENQKLNLIQHSEPTIDRPTNTSPKLPGENAATIDMMGQEVLIIKQNDMNFEIGGNEEFSLIETGTTEIKIDHVYMPKKKNIKEKNIPNKNLSGQVPEVTAMRRKLRTRSGTKQQSYLQSLSTAKKCRSEKNNHVLSNEPQSSDVLDHCSSSHSDLNENLNCDDSDTDCYYTDANGSETHSMKEKVKPNSIKMIGTVELEGRNTRSRKHLNRQSTDKSNNFSALSELDLKGKDSPCSTVCSSTNDEINNVKISKEKDPSISYNLRRRKLSSSSIVPLKKVKQTKRSESRDSFTKEVNCDEQSLESQGKFCSSPEEKSAKVLTRRNCEKVVVNSTSPSKQTEIAELMQIESSVKGSVQHSENSPKSNRRVSPVSPKYMSPKRHASASRLLSEAKTSNGAKCLKETDSICTAVSKHLKCDAREKKEAGKTPNLVCDTFKSACDKKDAAEDMISNMVNQTSYSEMVVVEKQSVSIGKYDSLQEFVTQSSSSKTNDKSDSLNESQSAGDRDSFEECTDSVVCKKIDGFDASTNENQVNRQKETISFDEVEGSSASKYMDNSKFQETQRHHLAVKEEDINVGTLKNKFMKQLFLSDSGMEPIDDLCPSYVEIKCRKSKRIKRCTSGEISASNLKYSETSGEGSCSVSSTTEISANSRIIRRTKSDPSKFGNQLTNMPILKSRSPKKTCLKPKLDKDETFVLSSPLRSSKSHINETSSSLEKKRVKSSKTHRKKLISKQSNKTKDSVIIAKQKALVDVSCDTSKLSSDMPSSLSLQLDKSNTGSVCNALNNLSISSQEHTVNPFAESGTTIVEENDKPLNVLEVKLDNADRQSAKSTEIPCEKLHNGTEPTLMEKRTSVCLGNDDEESVDAKIIDFMLKEAAHFRRWEGTERMETFWKQVEENPKGKVVLIPSADMPNPEEGPGLYLYRECHYED